MMKEEKTKELVDTNLYDLKKLKKDNNFDLETCIIILIFVVFLVLFNMLVLIL